MTDSTDPLAPIIEALKEPVALRPGLSTRVMAEIAAVEAPTTRRSWWQRRWTVQVSPLGALAAAAAVVAAVLVSRPALGPQALATAPVVEPASGEQLTQFILVAPEAAEVAVVGDFNDWKTTATPLARGKGNGVWWVTVPLAPGRYRYAFVVDGTVWRPDPGAPSLDDEFGRPSSVLTIGGA